MANKKYYYLHVGVSRLLYSSLEKATKKLGISKGDIIRSAVTNKLKNISLNTKSNDTVRQYVENFNNGELLNSCGGIIKPFNEQKAITAAKVIAKSNIPVTKSNAFFNLDIRLFFTKLILDYLITRPYVLKVISKQYHKDQITELQQKITSVQTSPNINDDKKTKNINKYKKLINKIKNQGLIHFSLNDQLKLILAPYPLYNYYTYNPNNSTNHNDYRYDYDDYDMYEDEHNSDETVDEDNKKSILSEYNKYMPKPIDVQNMNKKYGTKFDFSKLEINFGSLPENVEYMCDWEDNPHSKYVTPNRVGIPYEKVFPIHSMTNDTDLFDYMVKLKGYNRIYKILKQNYINSNNPLEYNQVIQYYVSSNVPKESFKIPYTHMDNKIKDFCIKNTPKSKMFQALKKQGKEFKKYEKKVGYSEED